MKKFGNLESVDNVEEGMEKEAGPDAGEKDNTDKSPLDKVKDLFKNPFEKKESGKEEEAKNDGAENSTSDAKSKRDKFIESLRDFDSGDNGNNGDATDETSEDEVQAHGDGGARTKDSEKSYDDER